MLDIPIGTVMSRLHRGRKAMQKALFEYAEARGLAGTGDRRRDADPPWMTATRPCGSWRPSSTARLPDEELVEIRAHLEGCPDCFEAFDFHAELKAVIAAKCRSDEMPPGLLARIEQCFAGGHRRRRPHRLTASPAPRIGWTRHRS